MNSRSPTSQADKLIKTITDYRSAIFALIAFIVGIALMVLSIRITQTQNPSSTISTYLEPILRDIGSLIITTGGISLVYDLLMKRTFVQEILSKVKVSDDIEQAGIEQITFNPKESPGGISWSKYIRQSKRIDVYFVHGIGWTLNNESNLKEAAANRRSKLRLFLPNYENQDNLKQISLRYNKSIPTLREDIIRAAKRFDELRANAKANVYVGLTDFAPPHSMYCFDDMAIIAFSSVKTTKPKVPHFIGKRIRNDTDETIFNFVDTEFQALLEQSKELPQDFRSLMRQ
ncbi:MAG: hypothetical protein H6657_29445 [Ardenticatenaceae bacterium]|nr:hypothetical protein [Ardenticatenaceae bacterium]